MVTDIQMVTFAVYVCLGLNILLKLISGFEFTVRPTTCVHKCDRPTLDEEL